MITLLLKLMHFDPCTSRGAQICMMLMLAFPENQNDTTTHVGQHGPWSPLWQQGHH